MCSSLAFFVAHFAAKVGLLPNKRNGQITQKIPKLYGQMPVSAYEKGVNSVTEKESQIITELFSGNYRTLRISSVPKARP